MIQNLLSQVVSSLDSMYSKNIDIVLHRKLLMKSCYNLKPLCEYCQFFLYDLLGSNCTDTSRPKFGDTPRPKCVDYFCKQYL